MILNEQNGIVPKIFLIQRANKDLKLSQYTTTLTVNMIINNISYSLNSTLAFQGYIKYANNE